MSRDVGWKKAISSIRFNKGIIALIVASPMPAGSVHGAGGGAEGSRAVLLAPACPQDPFLGEAALKAGQQSAPVLSWLPTSGTGAISFLLFPQGHTRLPKSYMFLL